MFGDMCFVLVMYAEDIEVQDNADDPVDTAAEENTDVDIVPNGERSAAAVELKSSLVQQKSGGMSKGPLKSIMKKREERAREKIQRKESDVVTPVGLAAPKRGSHFKEFLELHVSKSPRHSVSMSSVATATVSGETSTDHTTDSTDCDSSLQFVTPGQEKLTDEQGFTIDPDSTQL